MASYKHNQNFRRTVARQLESNSRVAGAFIVSRVQKAISRNQPRRRTASGRWVGLNPSRPGTPPKVLSGDLRRSIAYRVSRRGNQVSFFVVAGSSKVRYARRLEATTSEGGMNRPYLRSTIWKHRKQIMRLLTRNKVK